MNTVWRMRESCWLCIEYGITFKLPIQIDKKYTLKFPIIIDKNTLKFPKKIEKKTLKFSIQIDKKYT